MKAIVLFAALFLSLSLSGQTFTPKTSNGGGFNVESGAATKETFTCEGKTFQVWVTESGAKFVKGLSAKGTTYPVWIGEATGKSFEGFPVFRFKSGAYAYYKLTATGFPCARYLNAN